MKLMKKFVAAAIVCMLSVSMTMTSFARKYEYNTGSTEIIYDEMGCWASGKKASGSPWAWVNGYCYYYKDYFGGTKLKNCTTPDGYTVDEEGRWTIDGVPQTNGYGSYVMGTDGLYEGLNDDELWVTIRDEYRKLYANEIYGNEHAIAMMSTEQSVCGSLNDYGACGLSVLNPTDPYVTHFFEVNVGNYWTDTEENASACRNDVIEKSIKLAVGDHIGQELFNDIKAAGDPCSQEPTLIPVCDENGKWIIGDDGQVIMRTIDHQTDGVNFDLFDLAKWQNRQTDYGKTFDVSLHDADRGWWSIIVY